MADRPAVSDLAARYRIGGDQSGSFTNTWGRSDQGDKLHRRAAVVNHFESVYRLCRDVVEDLVSESDDSVYAFVLS